MLARGSHRGSQGALGLCQPLIFISHGGGLEPSRRNGVASGKNRAERGTNSEEQPRQHEWTGDGSGPQQEESSHSSHSDHWCSILQGPSLEPCEITLRCGTPGDMNGTLATDMKGPLAPASLWVRRGLPPCSGSCCAPAVPMGAHEPFTPLKPKGRKQALPVQSWSVPMGSQPNTQLSETQASSSEPGHASLHQAGVTSDLI